MPTYGNDVGYFKYVESESEVFNFNVPQNSYMYFMHRTQPIMYVKSVNMFNQQSVKAYALNEVPLTSMQQQQQVAPVNQVSQSLQQPIASQPVSEYVTKSEIAGIIQDAIRSEMRNKNNYKKNREEA